MRVIFVLLLLVVLMGIGKVSASPIDYRDLLARDRSYTPERFAYGKAADQFAELWLPEGEGPFPTVIMIHGGCWQASLPGVELMAGIADDLRQQGIAVWNIEYRRLGTLGAGYPGTFLDIGNAVDYLGQIAPVHKLSLEHLTVLGHSAGGQLALWAVARGHIPSSSKLYQEKPLPIEHAFSLAGINDLKAYRDKGPSACGGPSTIDMLVGADRRSNEDYYADTSPLNLLPLHIDQVIVSGSLDTIVPETFGSAYGEAAQKSGDKVVTMTIASAGHFELIDAKSEAWLRIKSLLLPRLN